MTETEELRALLDERGVEWRDESNGYASVTAFVVDGIEWIAVARSFLNDELDWMKLRTETSVTPQQAVNATLGRGECRLEIKDNMNESEGMGSVWIECSGCHMQFDYESDQWLMMMPFTPCCGKAVER